MCLSSWEGLGSQKGGRTPCLFGLASCAGQAGTVTYMHSNVLMVKVVEGQCFVIPTIANVNVCILDIVLIANVNSIVKDVVIAVVVVIIILYSPLPLFFPSSVFSLILSTLEPRAVWLPGK